MPFVADNNSMLRTADNTLSGTEAENAGNALVIDLGPGTGVNGLWWWIMNPTVVTGTTPGYTITLRYSADKVTWVNGPVQIVIAAGEYLNRIDTTYRYISYAATRGNVDNTSSAVSMGLTDAVGLGPR